MENKTQKTQFFFENPEEPTAQVDTSPGFFEQTPSPSKVQREKDLSKELATEKQAISEASMREIVNKVLSLEFGVYQKNYAVHIRPKHPRKNLSSNPKLLKAMEEAVKVLNEFVPQTLTVEIHPPRNDWEVKVISFVIRGGAEAWNFDKADFEAKGIPKLFAEIEKVIML